MTLGDAGWAFPPEPVPSRRTLGLLSGPALIRQSIRLILETEPGERVMRPGFGCGLRRFLMAPNTPGTRASIGRVVEAALSTWEPRIALQDVDVTTEDDPAIVLITISYTHVRDGTPGSFEVPFPLTGGA
jgi:hypothetical protein